MYCQMWIAVGMIYNDIDERCYKKTDRGDFFCSISLSIKSVTKTQPYDFVRVGFIGVPAKFIIDHCKKYDVIMVTGHIKEVKYDLSDGSTSYRTKAYGNSVRLIFSPGAKEEKQIPWEDGARESVQVSYNKFEGTNLL